MADPATISGAVAGRVPILRRSRKTEPRSMTYVRPSNRPINPPPSATTTTTRRVEGTAVTPGMAGSRHVTTTVSILGFA
jgi:hypothetical protein